MGAFLGKEYQDHPAFAIAEDGSRPTFGRSHGHRCREFPIRSYAPSFPSRPPLGFGNAGRVRASIQHPLPRGAHQRRCGTGANPSRFIAAGDGIPYEVAFATTCATIRSALHPEANHARAYRTDTAPLFAVQLVGYLTSVRMAAYRQRCCRGYIPKFRETAQEVMRLIQVQRHGRAQSGSPPRFLPQNVPHSRWKAMDFGGWQHARFRVVTGFLDDLGT